MLSLVALWLLATQHCGLEAAGLLAQGCPQAEDEHGCNASEHDTDGCQLVENSGYKLSNMVLKVSEPRLVTGLFLVSVNVVEPASEHSFETSLAQNIERPRDWVPTWRFVQRAAPPSRAPALA